MKNYVVNPLQYFLGHGNPSFERKSTLPSMTVPDMVMPLDEMLRRYANGGDITTFNPVYLGESDDLPINLERLTELEKQDLALDLGQFIETARNANSKGRKPAAAAAIPPVSNDGSVHLEEST